MSDFVNKQVISKVIKSIKTPVPSALALTLLLFQPALASDEQSSTSKSDCDKKAVPYSNLIVRPTGNPKVKYTISFGRFISERQANDAASALGELAVKAELVETVTGDCTANYLVLHGEFQTRQRARQEMWRLLSFQDPHAPNRLKGSVLFKP